MGLYIFGKLNQPRKNGVFKFFDTKNMFNNINQTIMLRKVRHYGRMELIKFLTDIVTTTLSS